MTQPAERTLDWKSNDGAFIAETADGYLAGVRKLNGVELDGYLAEVNAPKWFYTARCPTAANAKAWCRKIVISDRRAPLNRDAQ